MRRSKRKSWTASCVLSVEGQAASAGAFAPLERLEPRSFLAAVAWDGGGTLDNWEDPLNWNPDGVPGFADDVTIDIAGTPTITYTNATGDHTINSLVCREAVSFNTNDTLTIVTTVELDATWTLAGAGVIDGGTWDVTGGLLTVNGGGFTERTLRNMTVVGEIRHTGSDNGSISLDNTTFTAFRFMGTSGSVALYFPSGSVVAGDIIVESTGAGTGHFIRSFVAGGTLTLAPTCEIVLAATSTANLEFDNLSVVNDGVVRSLGAVGRDITFRTNVPSLINNGTIEAGANAFVYIAAAAWTNSGSLLATGGTLNLGGTFATSTMNAAGVVTTGGGTINLRGALTNDGTLALSTGTGNWILDQGASIVGGTVTYSGGAFLRVGGGGQPARLANVMIAGDLVADIGGGRLQLGVGARFTNLRITGTATAVTIGCEPGYVLEDDVLVESTGGGSGHELQMTSNGTLTLSPSGSIRVPAGATKRIIIGNTGSIFNGAMTLVNQGLISAESSISGQTIIVSAASFANEGALAVTLGELEVGSAAWSNAAAGTITATGGLMDLQGAWTSGGSLTASGGILTLAGTWSNSGAVNVVSGTVNLGGVGSTTAGIGTWMRSGGTVNVIGTLNNAGGTITLSAATTGVWIITGGGQITGGTINTAAAATIDVAGNNSNNRIDAVTVNGEIRLINVGSSWVRITGGTTFTTLRMMVTGTVASAVAGFSAGSVITGAILCESSSGSSQRIEMESSGTLTLAPSGSIRLSGGTNPLNLGQTFVFPGAMTSFVNQGTISSEVAGEILTVYAPSFTNQGTLQVSAGTFTIDAASAWSTGAGAAFNVAGGTLNLGGTWNATSGIGAWTRSGGTVNITGTLTNTGSTIMLGAATTGSWLVNSGGTIVGGSISTAPGAVIGAAGSTAGTLNGVTVNGEVHLGGAGSAVLSLINGSSFTTLRFNSTGSGSSIATFAPGSIITGDIFVENSNGGNAVSIGLTAVGSLTIDSGCEIRISPGAATGMTIGVSVGAGTSLINNGLISADAAGRTLTIGSQFASFTNNGILQTTNATAVLLVSTTAWENDGQILCPLGRVDFGGTFSTIASTGVINPTGGTIRFSGTVSNTGSVLGFANGSTGFIELGFCTINGGTIAFPATTSNRGIDGIINLSGVTLDGEFTLRSGLANAIRVTNGITINGTLIHQGHQAASVIFNGGVQALGGSGSIVMGAAGISSILSASSGSTVTIAPGFSISGFGTIMSGWDTGGTGMWINQGTITANSSGNSLTLSSTITSFANAGLMQATSGGTLVISNSQSTAQLGDVRNVSGTVRIAGDIDNSGDSLDFNATTGIWTLGSSSGSPFGVINGGMINASAGFEPICGFLRLNNGVTYNGNFSITVASGPYVVVTGGLTFNGTLTVSSGNRGVEFSGGTQTLGGNCTYLLTNGGSLLASNSAVLTIASTVTIQGRGSIAQGSLSGGSNIATLINNGTIRNDGQGTNQSLSIGPLTGFTNNGLVEAANVANMSVNVTLAGFTNVTGSAPNQTLTGGAWRIVGGGQMVLTGIQATTNAATVYLDNATSFGVFNNLRFNTGTLELANGRSFGFTPAANLFSNSGTFIKSGTGTTTVGASITFDNTGTVRVDGGTLTLAGPVGQSSGGTLSGGMWIVTGTLGMPAGTDLTAIGANTSVTLDGPGASFGGALAHLASNAGSLTLRNSAVFDIMPAGNSFTNTGTFATAGSGVSVIPSGVTFVNGLVEGDGARIIVGSDLRSPGGLSFPGSGPGGRGVIDIFGVLVIDGDGTYTGTVNLHTTGTLTGAGEFTVLGTFNWFGGTQSGTGRTIVGSFNTLNMVGDGVMTLARAMDNIAVGNWTGGCLQMVGGSFTNGPDGLFNITGMVEVASGGGANTFTNEGGFIIQEGGDANLGGDVQYTNSGSFVIAAPTTFDEDTVFDGHVVLEPTGSIDGPGNVTFNNLFDWLGGTIFGPGARAVSASGVFTMSGEDNKFLSQATFDHLGTAGNWTGGCLGMFNATFNNALGASFDIFASPMLDVVDLGGANQFNNAGLITIQTGTVIFGVPGTNTGTIIVIPPDTLVFSSPAGFTHMPGSTLEGPGGVSFLSGTHTFPTGAFRVAGPIHIGQGVSLSIPAADGSFPNYNPATHTFTGGDWSIGAGAILNLSGAEIWTIAADTSFTLTGAGAVFSALDTLSVVNGALALEDGAALAVVPGNGTSTLLSDGTITLRMGTAFTVTGNFTAGAASTLVSDIAGTASELIGRMIVSGGAALGGTAQLAFVNGYTPTLFSNHRFLTSAGATGAFAATVVPASPPFRKAAVVSDGQGLRLLYTHAADFNNSSSVSSQDIFDFLGAFFTPGSTAADFNRSGMVTSQDIFDFLAAFFSP